MASDGSILLTIRSAFRDEGMRKADAAVRDVSRSANRATASFQRVATAMGSLGGAAGKVGGQIAGIFSSFATGGVVGLAVAGITAAFGVLVKKMEEAREKAAETAKGILASMSEVGAALKKSFSLASSVAGAQAERDKSGRSGLLAQMGVRQSAAVKAVRQGAAVSAAGAATPEEARLIQLGAEVKAAEIERKGNIEAAEVKHIGARKRLGEADAALALVKKEAGAVDANHAENIRRYENYIAAYDKSGKEFADEWWGGEWLWDKFGNKQTREDVGKRLEEERKARKEDANAYKLKIYKAGTARSAAADAAAAASDELEAARGDRSVEVAEANLAAERRRQAEAAERQSEAEEKAAKAAEERRKAEEKAAKVADGKRKAQEKSAKAIELRDRKLAAVDAAIATARVSASEQSARIDALQGAVAWGRTIPEIVAERQEGERERAANNAKARRNLLGKIETARRNGNSSALSKWQGMLDTLDGKNTAADRLARLEAARDEIRKQSAAYLKSIADKMGRLGL